MFLCLIHIHILLCCAPISRFLFCSFAGTCLAELYLVPSDEDNNNNNKKKSSPSAEMPLCDCTSAHYRGQQYVGKYCEMPLDDSSMCSSSSTSNEVPPQPHSSGSPESAAVDHEDSSSSSSNSNAMIHEQRHFCLHGGTCLDHATPDASGDDKCFCTTGFRGPHW